MYSGKFVSKKLSIRDIAALGVRKAQLNGGMHHDYNSPGHGVDEQTDEFNNMVAHLELAIVEAPDWWDLDEITDVAILGIVYKEVISFENTFLGRGSRDPADTGNEHGGTGEGSGSTDSPGTGDDRDPSALVVEEVLDPLEP